MDYVEQIEFERQSDPYWSDYRAGLFEVKCPCRVKPLRGGGREDAPLHRMTRKQARAGMSLDERYYTFFRRYVSDVESGQIASSDASYWLAVREYQKYDALVRGWIKVQIFPHETKLKLTREVLRALYADDNEELKRLAMEQREAERRAKNAS